MNSKSLRAHLSYEPKILKFGTSGRRGEMVDLTQLEIYINALGELEYLQSLPRGDGGICRGEELYFAYDLRPSSTRFVPEQGGRGEIAQAIERAIRDSGMRPVNLGAIPTPALTFYALQHNCGSIMITGSHIPFDRNGYKTNSSKGELLKKDETPVNVRVEQIRQHVYAQSFEESPFNTLGLFKEGHIDLPSVRNDARQAYMQRYLGFFAGQSLRGQRLVVYQHSAVGRDLLVQILRELGAECLLAGRSDTFVPIDTENIDEPQMAAIQALASDAWAKHGPIDAVISTDGDSDRPLVLGVEALARSEPGAKAACQARFFGGDLVGMIVAEYLGADAVVVPISCNDAVDRGALQKLVEPKTRIGSPYVIAGMEEARRKGRRIICGWEANGGFLTGSDIERNGKVLKALPTRDAILPILGILFSQHQAGGTISSLFARLPKRFSRAALLRNFPRVISLKIIEAFSPTDSRIKEVIFTKAGSPRAFDVAGNLLETSEAQVQALQTISRELQAFFSAESGFGNIAKLNCIDGLRIYFDNDEVAHIRPSGNADELRIYAVANTQARADMIASFGVVEPNGILRQMARAVVG